MNKRAYVAKMTTTWCLCSLFFSPLVGAEPLRIAVWHTNDIHGWIAPRPAVTTAAAPGRLVGGAAALARVYRQEPLPKILLDGGDWFQGTPEGTMTRGKAVADVFNAVPYDAVVVGNHDFDFGEAVLREAVRAIKVPVLGANVYIKATGRRPAYLRPHILKDVGGVTVGVFGLLTTQMRSLTFEKNFAGLEFRREADEAKAAVKELRRQGAAVVIALTHVGLESPDRAPFEGDQTLAATVPGIDLIVGGHSHTALKDPIRDATYGTLIVQAGSYLTMAGRVEVEFDAEKKKVVRSTAKLVDLWIDAVGEDPDVKAVVDARVAAVGQLLEVVVATAATALTHDRKLTVESSLGDWMTDCEREWAGSDVALMNSGGIRAIMPAGPVTLRTLFNIMPFDNTVVKLRMKGRSLADVLEHGVAGGKGMIQVSGVEVVYDAAKPRGERLVRATIAGKRLDPGESYSVAAPDFMVRGGDGYGPFASAESRAETGKLLRDVLRECAQRQRQLQTPASGRVRAHKP